MYKIIKIAISIILPLTLGSYAIMKSSSTIKSVANDAPTPSVITQEAPTVAEPPKEAKVLQIVPDEAPKPVVEKKEDCSKVTLHSEENSENKNINTNSTNVVCQKQTDKASTTVNVTSETKQKAVSGDSTGTSGSASNHTTEDIKIDIH